MFHIRENDLVWDHPCITFYHYPNGVSSPWNYAQQNFLCVTFQFLFSVPLYSCVIRRQYSTHSPLRCPHLWPGDVINGCAPKRLWQKLCLFPCLAVIDTLWCKGELTHHLRDRAFPFLLIRIWPCHYPKSNNRYGWTGSIYTPFS